MLATQNPIEKEGTYPLPEAQVDRFMFKVLVGYPTTTDEIDVVQRMPGGCHTGASIDPDGLVELKQEADAVYVDPSSSICRAARQGHP